MTAQTGKPRRWRMALVLLGTALVSILAVFAHKVHKDGLAAAELAAALGPMFPPFIYDRAGNRVPGHDIDDGFEFIPAAGDAGSWGGIGTWYEHKNGQVKVVKGAPEFVIKRWLEQMTPEERERWQSREAESQSNPQMEADAATPGEGDASETE